MPGVEAAVFSYIYRTHSSLRRHDPDQVPGVGAVSPLSAGTCRLPQLLSRTEYAFSLALSID